MPNAGHRWTEAEEQDVLALSWDEFTKKWNGPSGYDISYDAYRQRKSALKRGAIERFDPEPIEVGSANEFVGVKSGFFDIETTFSTQPRVLYAAVADSWGNVHQFALTDPQYKGRDWLDDSVLVDKYARFLEQNFSHLISWNGKLFDIPVLNGRLNYWRVARQRGEDVRADLVLRPIEPAMHTDLMYYASGQFNRIGRRSLESVSTFFNSPHRKTPLDVRTWDKADHGDMEAYGRIGEHCDADVLVLRDVYDYLSPHIRNVHR